MNVQLETSLKVILIKKPRSINIREEKTPKRKRKKGVSHVWQSVIRKDVLSMVKVIGEKEW